MTLSHEPPGSMLRGVAVGLALTGAVALLIVGAYLAPLPAALLLGVVGIGVPAAWLLWSRVELGLVALLFFAASLLPRELLVLPLPIGSLDLADLSLFAVVGVAAARLLTAGALPWPTVGLPLVAFGGWAVVSALYAIAYQGVEPPLVLRELRPPVYFVGCFLAAATLVRPAAVTRLLIGLFVVADLTVGALVLQQFLGKANPLLAAMSGGTWEMNQADDSSAAFGALRIVPPAHTLIFVATVLAGCLILHLRGASRLRAVLLAQFFYLNLGLLLTYTRAQWVASMIAFALVALLVAGPARARLARFGLGLVAAAVLFVGLVESGLVASSSPQFVTALTARASTILTPEDTLDTGSLEWRVFEAEEATRSIAEHPLLGVGLGNDYRPVTLFQGEADGWLWKLDGDSRLTRFVHNSYLFVATKMGLPGLVLFLWFCLAFLIGGLRAYWAARDAPHGAVVLAMTCAFAGLLEWAFFQSHFMQTASMAGLGVMAGVVAAASGEGAGMRHLASRPAGWAAHAPPREPSLERV